MKQEYTWDDVVQCYTAIIVELDKLISMNTPSGTFYMRKKEIVVRCKNHALLEQKRQEEEQTV
jgi:hypothetical protein